MLNLVTPTRCPTCGVVQASTVCSFCKSPKPPFFHSDIHDRDPVYQERDLTTWGSDLRPGR